MDRPNINNVKFSNVASGLHAKTEDHILVTAHDVFDFTYTYTDTTGTVIVGEYQDVINQLNKGGGGTSWTPTAGFAITITPGTGSYQFSVDESQLSFSLAKLREYMLKGYPSSTNPIQVSEIIEEGTFKGWSFSFDKSKTDLVDAATLTAALANYQKILTAPLGSGISIDTDNKISVLVDDNTIKIDPTTGKLYAASTGETYQGGEGITIDTTTNPKSIKVDSSVYQVKSVDSSKGLDNTSGVASIKIDESSMEFTSEGKLKAKAGAAYEAGTGIKFTPSADKTSISVDDTVYKVKDASGGLKITSDAKVVVDEDVYKIKDIATQEIAGTQVPVGLALDGDGKVGVITESTSITFNTAGRLMVSLESNGGITAASGLKVDDSIYTIKKIADANSGLTSVSGVIAVNTGNGIDVDSNGIKVKADPSSPLSVSTSGVGLNINADDFIIDSSTLRGRKLVNQISVSTSTESGTNFPYALDIALASPQTIDTHPSLVIPASKIAYTPYLSSTSFRDTQSAIGFILLKTCEPQVTEFTVSGQPAPGSTTMYVTFKSAATTRYGITPEFVKYEVFAPGATAWAEASTIEGGTYNPGGTEGWLVGDYYFRAKYQAYISSAGEHVSSYSEIVTKTIVGSMYVDYTDKADYPEGYTEYIIPTQYATTTITQHVDEGVVLRTPTARESTSHSNLWVFTPKECGKALHFYKSDGSEISWVASGIATVKLGGHDYYAQKLTDIGLNEPFSTAIVMLRDVQVNDTSIVNAGVAKIVANTSKGLDFKNTSATEGLEVKVDESTVKFDTSGKVSSAIWTVPTATPTEFKTDKETGYINGRVIITAPTIASEYDETSTYQIDDVVYHDNVLYACNTKDTTGAWDASKWNVFSTPLYNVIRANEEVIATSLRDINRIIIEDEEVTASAIHQLASDLVKDEEVIATTLLNHRDQIIKKQDILTAGTGVSIQKVGSDTVISADGKKLQGGTSITIDETTTAGTAIINCSIAGSTTVTGTSTLGSLTIGTTTWKVPQGQTYYAGNGLSLNTTNNNFSVNTTSNGGLSATSSGLGIKLASSPGLYIDSNGLKVKVDGTTMSINSSGQLVSSGKTYQAGTNITITNPTSATPTINATGLESLIPLQEITTAASSYSLDPGTYYVLPTNQSSYTIITNAGTAGYLHSYMFEFTTTSTSTTSLVTLPSGVNWVLDPPTDAGTYQVSITRTMATYIMY